MGILDKLKGKKTDVQAQSPEPQTNAGNHADERRPVSVSPHTAQRQSAILVRPLLSEKGAHFASTGKYVFIVNRKANKPEIKKSIQKIYNVHVEDVKIINLPSKKRRYGMTSGETSAFKKAIVVLRSGEKIPGIIESVG